MAADLLRLDRRLVQYTPHRQTQDFVKAINAFYLENAPLWDQDDSWQGFQWLCADVSVLGLRSGLFRTQR